MEHAFHQSENIHRSPESWRRITGTPSVLHSR
jgi:hypothetical protein